MCSVYIENHARKKTTTTYIHKRSDTRTNNLSIVIIEEKCSLASKQLKVYLLKRPVKGVRLIQCLSNVDTYWSVFGVCLYVIKPSNSVFVYFSQFAAHNSISFRNQAIDSAIATLSYSLFVRVRVLACVCVLLSVRFCGAVPFDLSMYFLDLSLAYRFNLIECLHFGVGFVNKFFHSKKKMKENHSKQKV